MKLASQPSIAPLRRLSHSTRYGLWSAGGVLILILTFSSSQAISSIQVALASGFLYLSIRAYLLWAETRDTKIPVWTLLCGVHFVFYGIAIFSASRISPSQYDHNSELADTTLTTAMFVGIIGLLSIGVGRKAAFLFGPGRKFRPNFIDIGSHTPVRIHLLLLLGIATNLFGLPFYGTVLWNISVIAFSILPLTALLWIVLGSTLGKLRQLDLLLASIFFLTRLLYGARFGASLGAIVVPVLLIALAAVSVNRRLPWGLITAVTCLALFLQPSKGTIREQMATGNLGGNAATVLLRWVNVAASGWSDVFSGAASLQSQLSLTASRMSLLTMTGVILSKTPDTVPYQLGSSYPQLLQNLIPRFVWREKPTANATNRFFQVEYGLASQQDLSLVSMACGFEAEGYMNFGWVGIVGVGLFVGFVFGCYEFIFFSPRSSLAVTALGLSLLPGFLTIEAQLVVYLGGILQVCFLAGIIFLNPKSRVSLLRRNFSPRRSEMLHNPLSV